jgi:Fur family transcriptional regulator, zinc uptake regulator
MGKEHAAPHAAHSHHHHHGGAQEAAALLAHAETVCGEKRLQFTPLRRRVFEALAAGSGPLGAYDLVEQLGRERRISPISVYRALEFLMEAGLIHRIAVRNTYLPCAHEHGAGETTVFLVCTLCGSVDELASSEIARDLAGTAAQVGFRPVSRAVELEGECQACREG